MTLVGFIKGAFNRGRAKLTPHTPESLRRLQICMQCPAGNLDRVTRKCTKCTCPVDDKVRLITHHCPDKFW